MNLIKVARYRSMPYIVNYTSNGGVKRYEWAGSKGNNADIKEIPEEVVQWLLMNSVCFSKGDLVIVEDKEEAKELVEAIDDVEQYKNNTHSREEVIKLLNGGIKNLEKELAKITVATEKIYIVDVAKDIKLSDYNKMKVLAKWMGIEPDVLFDNDEE